MAQKRRHRTRAGGVLTVAPGTEGVPLIDTLALCHKVVYLVIIYASCKSFAFTLPTASFVVSDIKKYLNFFFI